MVGVVVRLGLSVAMVLIAGIIAALRLLPLRVLFVLHPPVLKPDLDLLQKNDKQRRRGRKSAIISKLPSRNTFCTALPKRLRS